MNVKKELTDQCAHFFVAMIIILPLILWLSALSTLWVGLWVGIVRELTEESSTVSLKSIRAVFTSSRSAVDILFWGLGGLVTGLLFI